MEEMTCFSGAQWFFLCATILFILFLLLLINRLLVLRRDMAEMRMELLEKDKALEGYKSDRALLSPFGSKDSKSIILSVNAKGELTYLNGFAQELFGYAKEEIVGKSVFGRIFPDGQGDMSMVARVFSNPKLYVEYETPCLKKSGETVWVSWTNRVSYNEKGEPDQLHAVGFDISRRKKLEKELLDLSQLDPLTGVLNKQTFLDQGGREMARANEFKRQISVFVMKLSYFHDPSGCSESSFSDVMLKEIIALCSRAIHHSDIIGRVDDVEFAVILPETPLEDAQYLAAQLKEKIYHHNIVSLTGNKSAFVDVYFGFASKKRKNDAFDDLLLSALDDLRQNEKKALCAQKRKKR